MFRHGLLLRSDPMSHNQTNRSARRRCHQNPRLWLQYAQNMASYTASELVLLFHVYASLRRLAHHALQTHPDPHKLHY